MERVRGRLCRVDYGIASILSRRKRAVVAGLEGMVALAVPPTGVVVSCVTPALVHEPGARVVEVSTV